MDHPQRLVLKFFGPPQITVNGKPAEGFDSDKVRALLAYLVIEVGRPHRRERLAGLFWPDFPERSAKANLRQALANLRQIIDDRETNTPLLNITRQTIAFNPAGDAWCDVFAFMELVQRQPEDKEQLEEAVALYRGEFLEGFTLSDSAAFDNWSLQQRQALAQQLLHALSRLVHLHEASGSTQQAIVCARRQVELDPYREEAWRQLMILLAGSGRRSDALAQFETLRQLLTTDLDVEPTAETSALYERIRSGEFQETRVNATTRVGERGRNMVRSYELRELIGRGHFGAVYRAYQPAVGRDVALKIILPDYADDPDFIRRFEVEAQLVARLEHPAIVPLYDFWREPGSAFLVMRWLRGGSLENALQRGPWNLEPAVSLLDQITSALDLAHRHGVIHRDIKPGNILLDEESNAYLTDFGVASMVGPLDIVNSDPVQAINAEDLGSLGYRSPESARSDQATIQTDIYSLGVVLYELLAAQHPFPDAEGQELLEMHMREPLPSIQVLRPDLPPEVDAVILKATAKDPDERYSDALSLSAAFRQAIMSQKTIPQLPTASFEDRNPYKGLRPFEETDAREFFGRETLAHRLLHHLQNSRFLAVVGPSGSGKSSIVKAGVIPAVRQDYLPGSQDWFIVELTPGSHPLESLETALLRVAINPPDSLLGQMQEDTRGLLRAIRRSLPDDTCQLFLFIDQFEELFTLVDNEAEKVHFLKSLWTAVSEDTSLLQLVITLRADYYDRPLLYTQFGELMRQHTEVVLPLSADELERVITGPAEEVGLLVEPGLVAEIVADVTDQPGTLPLLQYALTELYENRDDHRLNQEVYRAIGGVSGALARRAEELYTKLDIAGQEATRQIFLRLVALGEEGEYNRRRALRAEILTLSNYDRSQLNSILDAYGTARLLTFDRDASTRAPTVEVAHEAMLREWDRLQSWLEDNWSDLIRHRQLSRATSEWIGAGELNESFLLRGDRLAMFESWADKTQLALSADERAYLQASIARREERAAAERKRLEQESRLEGRAKFRLRALLVISVLALLVVTSLIVTTLFFSQQQRQAETFAQLTLSRDLVTKSQANLQVDPELSALLALQAAEHYQGVDEDLPPELESLLHQVAQAEAVLYTFHTSGPIAFALDGSAMAVGSEESILRAWNPLTGQDKWGLVRYQGRNQAIGDLAFSPDGDLLATASPDGLLKVWDANTGEEIGFIERPEGFTAVAFNPVSEQLLTIGSDESVHLWDLTQLAGTNKSQPVEIIDPVLFAQTTSPATTVVYSPDGQNVAMFVPGTGIIIVDAASGEQQLEIPVVGTLTYSLAFSPDGHYIAGRSGDLDVMLWDAHTGAEFLTVSDSSSITNVTFSPDGRYLATANDNGQATLWDMESGAISVSLSGHAGRILGMAFHPNGRLLATSAADGLTRIWDLDQAGSELFTIAAHEGRAYSVKYNADSSVFASAGDDGWVKLWDAETGTLLHALPGPKDRQHFLAISPDGQKLLAANRDGGLTIWEISSGLELLSLESDEQLTVASVNDEGTRIAAGSQQGTIYMWDALTGEQIFAVDSGGDQITALLFISPLVINAWDETGLVTAWDTASGNNLGEVYCPTTSQVDADLSLDGRFIAVACSQVYLVDRQDLPQERTILFKFAHNDIGQPTGVAFNHDGTLLATADSVGVSSLWNTATGQLQRRVSGPQAFLGGTMRQGGRGGYGTTYIDTTGWRPLSGVDISPDGRYLATAGSDGTINVYILSLAELTEAIRSHLSRDLSDTECQTYLNLPACPQE